MEEILEAFQITEPGRHVAWSSIAGTYVKICVIMGRYEEAVRQGRALLESAANKEVGYRLNYLKMPLAVAEAEMGHWEQACSLSTDAIESFVALGSTGLNMGLAYETRAQVALLMQDEAEFIVNAELCCAQYAKGEGSTLLNRFESKIRRAHETGFELSDDLLCAVGLLKPSDKVTTSMVANFLAKHTKYIDRIQYALNMLVDNSNSLGGFLYLVHREELALFATNGDYKVSPELGDSVGKYFQTLINDTMETTRTFTADDDSVPVEANWSLGGSERLYPLLLRHYTEKGYATTGLAVLVFEQGKDISIPAGLNTALSKFLDDFGDVAVIYQD
jgi:hypothetical protein